MRLRPEVSDPSEPVASIGPTLIATATSTTSGRRTVGRIAVSPSIAARPRRCAPATHQRHCEDDESGDEHHDGGDGGYCGQLAGTVHLGLLFLGEPAVGGRPEPFVGQQGGRRWRRLTDPVAVHTGRASFGLLREDVVLPNGAVARPRIGTPRNDAPPADSSAPVVPLAPISSLYGALSARFSAGGGPSGGGKSRSAGRNGALRVVVGPPPPGNPHRRDGRSASRPRPRPPHPIPSGPGRYRPSPSSSAGEVQYTTAPRPGRRCS